MLTLTHQRVVYISKYLFYVYCRHNSFLLIVGMKYLCECVTLFSQGYLDSFKNYYNFVELLVLVVTDTDMNCNEFSILNGCSKCNCSLTDTDYLPLLSSSSITDIIDQLITESNSFGNNKIILSDSRISCAGDISIVYNDNSLQNDTKYNRSIYYKVINIWLKYNMSRIDDAMNIIYLILFASILHYNEQEQKATDMIEYMQKLFIYIQSYVSKLGKE